MKTLALRARVFIHCFLVFGYPGETLALVVHILHPHLVIISINRSADIKNPALTRSKTMYKYGHSLGKRRVRRKKHAFQREKGKYIEIFCLEPTTLIIDNWPHKHPKY